MRRSPSTAPPSGSSPTSPRPTSTWASPWAPRNKIDEAIAEYRRPPSGSAPTYAEGLLPPRQRPVGPGKTGRGDRRIPRPPSESGPITPRPPATSATSCTSTGSGEAGGDRHGIPRPPPASSPPTRRPHPPRHGPGRSREDGGGDRRIPGSHPHPARQRRRPPRTSAPPCASRVSWTRRSPEFREATRIQPDNAKVHVLLGGPWVAGAMWMRRSAAEYRASLHAIQPDDAVAGNLGIALEAEGNWTRRHGRAKGGPAASRAGPREASPGHRPADRQRGATDTPARSTAALLEGRDEPANAVEGIEFAVLCGGQGRHAARPARLYAEALKGGPRGPATLASPAPLQRRLRRGAGRLRAGSGRPAARRGGAGRFAKAGGSTGSGPSSRPGGGCSTRATRRRWRASSGPSGTGRKTATWPASAIRRPWPGSPSPSARSGGPSGPTSSD